MSLSQKLSHKLKCNIFLFSCLFALFALSGCLRSTGPTEVGVLVKKVSIFGKSGVQDSFFPSGSSYLVWPLISDWYTFDTKTVILEMAFDERRGDRNYQDEVRFKTIDGNDIGLDIILSYRIIPEKAAYILQNVATNDRELKDKIVRSVTRSKTRDIFGELKTEEFYNADERTKKEAAAEKELNLLLNPLGVRVERVATKDYRFNPEYQQAIEDKKVADQKAEKFQSETQATLEEYLKKLEQAKGQVGQMVAKANGEFDRLRIESDAYYNQQVKRAEAVRAEGEAEAKGIAEMNKALAGSGGEVMVKMKLAEALQGKRIILLPQGSGSGMDLRTTNVNSLLETVGTKHLAEQASTGEAEKGR